MCQVGVPCQARPDAPKGSIGRSETNYAFQTIETNRRLWFRGMDNDVLGLLEANAWFMPTADSIAKLYVTELGQGRPVVVLHAGPGAHFGYLADAVQRSLHSARFVLFDQRGSLLSPVTPDHHTTLTADTLVADLEQLRQTLGYDKLTLLGHSWGTLLAQLYFLAYPANVERMILTGAMWPHGSLEERQVGAIERQTTLRNRPAVTGELRSAGLDGDPDQLSPKERSYRERLLGLASFSIDRLEYWRSVRSLYWSRQVGNAIGESLPATYDIRPTLNQHPVPISIIQGDQDYIDPAAKTWAGLRPNHPTVNVTVISSAGHNAWIDDPNAFDQALAAAIHE